eukprot:GDKK01063279.1.p1 GENE.GDKK01063279.1~~GDKK01063279.1.p1  ORF type:complete len:228 (+),score=82.51 GDKK01063279.1:1-684(+)
MGSAISAAGGGREISFNMNVMINEEEECRQSSSDASCAVEGSSEEAEDKGALLNPMLMGAEHSKPVATKRLRGDHAYFGLKNLSSPAQDGQADEATPAELPPREKTEMPEEEEKQSSQFGDEREQVLLQVDTPPVPQSALIEEQLNKETWTSTIAHVHAANVPSPAPLAASSPNAKQGKSKKSLKMEGTPFVSKSINQDSPSKCEPKVGQTAEVEDDDAILSFAPMR